VWQSQTVQSAWLLFCGIAALSVTFLLAAKRKVTKRKLPAAPASMKGCALTSGVVAEPDDADFCGKRGSVLYLVYVPAGSIIVSHTEAQQSPTQKPSTQQVLIVSSVAG